jgi:predicted  nucleic acid-binding Zn-ribbon protein
MNMMSDEVSELFSALCKAQKEMKVAPKDSDNTYHKSKYADLQTVWETIKSPLCNNELTVSQVLNESGINSSLTTILAHKSGQWIKSVTPIKLRVLKVDKQGNSYEVDLNPQEFCAAVTYFRRMSLSAITGCYAGEADDDAEGIMDRKQDKIETVKKPELQSTVVKLPKNTLLSKQQVYEIRKLIGEYPEIKEEILSMTGKELVSEIEASRFNQVMACIQMRLKEEGVA